MEIQSLKHLEVIYNLLLQRKQNLSDEYEIMKKTIGVSTNQDANSIIIRIAKINREEAKVLDELIEGINHEFKRG